MLNLKYHCVSCKKDLEQDMLYCDTCMSGFEDRFVKCPECGCAIAGDDDFCAHCLTVFPKARGTPKPLKDDRARSRSKSRSPKDDLVNDAGKKNTMANDNQQNLVIDRPAEIWDVIMAPAYKKSKRKSAGRGKKIAIVIIVIVLLTGIAGVFAYFNWETVTGMLPFLENIRNLIVNKKICTFSITL